MLKPAILALIRQILTVAGTALVAKGFVQASDVEPVIGAILTIGSVVWSVADKRGQGSLAPAGGSQEAKKNASTFSAASSDMLKYRAARSSVAVDRMGMAFSLRAKPSIHSMVWWEKGWGRDAVATTGKALNKAGSQALAQLSIGDNWRDAANVLRLGLRTYGVSVAGLKRSVPTCKGGPPLTGHVQLCVASIVQPEQSIHAAMTA